jgi:hypothetical protein
VPETAALLARGQGSPAGRLFFVHLNHTNRLLWDRNALDSLAKAGLGIAAEGQRLPL